MKKIISNVLLTMVSLLALSSCKSQFHFVTKNLPETDSSYIITKKGHRIDAETVVLKSDRFTVDDHKYGLDSIIVIKSKKKYFVREGGKLYQTVVYGKINLLRPIDNTYYPGIDGKSNSHSNFYLQRQGNNQIEPLTKDKLYEYLADNPEALKAAKAHYLWKNLEWVTFGAVTASFIYFPSTVDGNNILPSLAKPSIFMGSAMALHFIVHGIGQSKIPKAILIYNTTDQ